MIKAGMEKSILRAGFPAFLDLKKGQIPYGSVGITLPIRP